MFPQKLYGLHTNKGEKLREVIRKKVVEGVTRGKDVCGGAMWGWKLHGQQEI